MESAGTQVKSKRTGIGFFMGFLAVIGILAIAGIFVSFIVWISLSGEGTVSGKTILEVDFEKGFIEYIPADPIAQTILSGNINVRDIIEALEKASKDDRVAGLIGIFGGSTMGMAHLQEIRDAIIAFRSSGKSAIAFSETFGEFGPGNGAYSLASAFDEIFMQPSGDVGLTGLMYESFFIKNALDKLGIIPRGDRRYEYKSAFNMFTEEKYTEYHKEAIKKVMDSQFSQMVKDIAEGRNLAEDEVRQLIDNGPFLGQEAVDAGLVDGLAYRDEIYEKVKENAGKGAKLLYLSQYLKRAGRPHTKGTKVALIYGVGTVIRGKSGFDPLFLEPSMGSETVAKAFRDAVKDKDVKAILFRIDSPGGSYIASDTIWREVVRAGQEGKPVIVSMGNVAGSGGYFIAMGADKIIAQPGTITGSIGVLSVKLLTNSVWDMVGITWDEVHTSENSTVWSSTHDYTPEQWERFQDWLDRVYDDFTSKVALGRDLTKEKVLEIAKGRIWTGEDALALGLVDELGGYPAALRSIREALDLAEDAPINLTVFPKRKSLLEMLMGSRAESSESTAMMNVLSRFLQTIQPISRFMKETGIAPDKGILSMPEAYPGQAR